MAVAAAALADPEEIAQLARSAYSTGQKVVGAVADSAGLTAADDYMGWLAIAVIAYATLYPPLKMAWQIEQQVAGVLEQLYTWLGGAGTALDKGASQIVSSVEQFGSYLVSGRWL